MSEERDTEQATAAALIEAGRALFARHGYDGASVRAITKLAGTNLGAITYHFGSKRALYDRVVESSMLPLVERVESVVSGPGSPLEKIASVVRVYFEHLRMVPELPYLMVQELAVGRLPPVASIGPLRRLLGAISSTVEAGQVEGSIRPGPPLLLALATISQALHFSIMREPLRQVLGVDLHDPERWDSAVEIAIGFVRGGLAAGGAGGEGRGVEDAGGVE